MQSSDPGHLFQTTSQLSAAASRERKLKAAEKVGSPLEVASKVLGLVIRGQEAWVAESGWLARRVDLKTGKTIRTYKPHQGPVTSLSLFPISSPPSTSASPTSHIITGSWDKSIRIFHATSATLLATLSLHSDFIKSVTILPTSPPLLLSTSSDRACRVWDLSALAAVVAVAEAQEGSLEGKIPCVQVLRNHTRPVECAAYKVEEDGTVVVWTGDSLGVIKRWEVVPAAGEEAGKVPAKLVFKEDVKGHETCVAGLVVGEEGLWSASMDKSAVFHPFTAPSKVTLPHPAYVKSILPLGSLPLPNAPSLLLTGSEDEDIRVWDVEARPPKVVGVIRGHCGEVCCLDVWLKEDEAGKKEWAVVSAGLDATIRRWTLHEVMNPPELDYEPEEEEKGDVGLTEEEERELAELMSDED
ncbi:hypothetical protein IAT38_002375 [Cryptococcus sp. DSM 104549]